MRKSRGHRLFPVCCLQLSYISHNSHLYDRLSHPHDGTLLEDTCCSLSVGEWITDFCDLLMENSPSWPMCLGFLVRIVVLLSMICYVPPQTTSLVVQSVMAVVFLPLDSMEHCVQYVYFSAFAGDAIYAWQFKTHVIFVIFR